MQFQKNWKKKPGKEEEEEPNHLVVGCKSNLPTCPIGRTMQGPLLDGYRAGGGGGLQLASRGPSLAWLATSFPSVGLAS